MPGGQVVAGGFGGSIFSTSGGGCASSESVFLRGSEEGLGWITQPGQIRQRMMTNSHFNKPGTS
jgi:hypothetical protein